MYGYIILTTRATPIGIFDVLWSRVLPTPGVRLLAPRGFGAARRKLMAVGLKRPECLFEVFLKAWLAYAYSGISVSMSLFLCYAGVSLTRLFVWVSFAAEGLG